MPTANDRHNVRLGQYGEQEAQKYLKRQGYRVLERNYRCAFGEIDIICRWQEVLVFVEVKTRTSDKYGSPQEAITYQKMEHIRNSAMQYIEEKRCSFAELRFDVIAMLKQADGWQLEHIKSAF